MSLTVGFFTDTYAPEVNGVVTSLLSTARGLRKRGHRVIVVAPAHADASDDDPDTFRFRSAPFPFYPQFRMAFPLPARLLATLPNVPFDVIHAHSVFFVGCLGAYLAQRRHVPLAFTYHTRLSEYAHYLPVHQRITGPQAVWLSREFSNRCDFVIAPTVETAEILRSYGVDSAIEIIPTGVDLDMFGGAPRRTADDIRRAHAGPIALFAGRLGKEKNVELLIEAFALAREQVPGARLIIAGDGPLRGALRERAAALGIEGCVELVGPLDQPDLGAYYRAADAFAFASTSETQGLVLVEAMAHGLPVAAVDCPVSREVVRGDAGILSDASAPALARALARLLTDAPETRARRMAAAYAAAAPYSVDALAQRLESLYLRELAGAPAGRS